MASDVIGTCTLEARSLGKGDIKGLNDLTELVLRRASGGDGVRPRVTGAALTILGVLIMLFAPVGATGGCADLGGGCREFSANSWWGLIHWPAGWDTLFLPMLIIGVALVVTGVVLQIKPGRSRGSPDTAR